MLGKDGCGCIKVYVEGKWMWFYQVMLTKIGVKNKRMDVIIYSNVYEDRC